VDVVSAYVLIISSYIYVIGCGVAMTADVDGYSQININIEILDQKKRLRAIFYVHLVHFLFKI
jgi:hypothetical protein